jgi:hypothetical protein
MEKRKMEKRKMGWLHPAHRAREHGDKEEMTGFEKRRKGRRGEIQKGKESVRIRWEMRLPQSGVGVIVLSEILYSWVDKANCDVQILKICNGVASSNRLFNFRAHTFAGARACKWPVPKWGQSYLGCRQACQ